MNPLPLISATVALALAAPPPADPLPAGAVARLGTPLWRLPTEGRRLIVSPDGTTVLVATDTLHVERLDARTGRRLAPLGTPTFPWGYDLPVPCAVTTDFRLVAIADNDRGESSRTPFVSVRRSDDGGEHRQLKFASQPEKPEDPPIPAGYSGSRSNTITHLSATAFSPDGRTITAARRMHYRCTTTESREKKEKRVLLEVEDVTVGVWDIESGELRHELRGHTGEVHSLLFTADGKTLTTVSRDGTVRFWDVATGNQRGDPWKAGGPIHAAAHSPDRTLLAAGCDKAVLVWDTATGRLVRTLEFPAEARAVAFSPDGASLAAAGGDTVRQWTAATGQPVGDLQPAVKAAVAVAFAADGKTLFTAHRGEHQVRRWDAATCRPLPGPDGLGGPARLTAYTADGKRLLTFTVGEGFRLWDVAAGTSEAAGADDAQVLTALFAAGGRTRSALCEDSLASFVALSLGKANRLDQMPWLLGVSHDGRRMLAAGEQDGKPVLRVIEGETPGREIACEAGEERNAALAPDGTTVATAAGDSLCFIDVATGARRRHKLAFRKGRPGDEPFGGPAVKFAPDGSRLAVRGDGGTVLVVAADGRMVREIDTGAKHVSGLAFSPDGKTLLTATTFGGVSVWEVATGRRVRTEPAGTFVYDPSGRVLASHTEAGLRLTDPHTGAVVRACDVPGATAFGFAFSPDGRQLAASTSDCTVVVWDAGSPAEKPAALDAKELARLWAHLEGDDAGQAYAAIGVLAGDPARAIPFLDEQLGRKGNPEPAAVGLAHDRAIQVLERVGAADARRLLERLAGGAAGSAAARDALRRLGAHAQ